MKVLCVDFRDTNLVFVQEWHPRRCCTGLESSLEHNCGCPIFFGIVAPIVLCGGVSVLVDGLLCTLWHGGHRLMIWQDILGASCVFLFYSGVLLRLPIREGTVGLLLWFVLYHI